MAGETLNQDLSMEFLMEFQDKLQFAEEKYRHTLDPAVKINGLLKVLSMFYDSDRAFLVEIDWDLGIGICTYAWCDEGIEPQIQVMQHIPVEKFMVWIKTIRANQPVIIDVDTLDPIALSQYDETAWSGMRQVLIAPFSNRVNTGIIGIGNPKKYQNNQSFMLVLGYAVVSALNEIKLQERVDLVVKRVPNLTETEIYVSCFGGIEIRWAKGTLADEMITADQCYRLLAYLLCNYKKAKPVRELADIIWNDSVLNDPYRDLKNIVYRLKRFLSVIELDDLIIGSGGTFVINPKYKIYVDFDRFEDACMRFFSEANSDLKNSAFQMAREIYKGSLLPRCDHIHWFIPRIGYYQTLYFRLMKERIEQKLQEKDYWAVQKLALEGLETESHDTDFMVYQIISLYALGNRSLARNFSKRIETELTEEQKSLIQAYRR